MRPYLTHEHPIRFAHRGSRVLWPENTMKGALIGSIVGFGLGYVIGRSMPRHMWMETSTGFRSAQVFPGDDGNVRLAYTLSF